MSEKTIDIEMPADSGEKDIVIDGMKLHYSDTGKKEGLPVVLMHGWGCDHTTVASIGRLLESGMRVLSLDLPGHGSSDEPSTVWGIYEYTDLVQKFIKLLNLKNVTLIGHSFGGRISILMGSRTHEIHKIVLVDAAGIKPKRSLKWYWKVYSYKTVKKLLPLIFGKEKGEALLEKYRGKVGSSDYRNSTPVMRGIMSKCISQDLKYCLPDIKAPTLLIWGENDTATPLSDAKLMEKRIPDAGLVSFPGCGHYSFLDNPGGFAAVMREFFRKELSAKN